MKVGLIGLGRMGEGMSRRMMKAGIEVWGYRRNYDKAQEAYESGYVSGVTTTIENLVKVVKQKPNGGTQPGIYQMVVPNPFNNEAAEFTLSILNFKYLESIGSFGFT